MISVVLGSISYIDDSQFLPEGNFYLQCYFKFGLIFRVILNAVAKVGVIIKHWRLLECMHAMRYLFMSP